MGITLSGIFNLLYDDWNRGVCMLCKNTSNGDSNRSRVIGSYIKGKG